MIKIANITGARPQFIKLASISREIRKRKDFSELIIHTGQHYDKNMSEIFFKELDVPEPDFNLEVGSGSHAVQTANILSRIEGVLADYNPDWVLVYGDTNSTLAASIASAKLRYKIAHVEAGLRSFNRAMPEEINRIVTDHVSDLLFAPTRNAMELLEKEGLLERSLLVGDVMLDAVKYSEHLAEKKYGQTPIIPFEKYYLATVHRQENTDNPGRLKSIFNAFAAMDLPVVLPVHPRTNKLIKTLDISGNVHMIDPVGYLQMLILVKRAEKILTDSGGLQKETYFLEKQCITLRDETEWTETLENNWNILSGVDTKKILDSLTLKTTGPQGNYFGDGRASAKILDALI